MNNKYKIGIAVMGGGLVNDHGAWRMTRFDETGDRSGVRGDYIRAVAASYLHQEMPESVIIASGGKGYHARNDNQPMLCDVIATELIKLGVNNNDIVLENKSNSTFEQLKEIAALANTIPLKKVIIISNRFHVRRIKKMLEHFKQYLNFADDVNLEVVAAEKVVVDHDPKKWQTLIDQAYQSAMMKTIIDKENQGVKDIENGKYVIKNFDTYEK